MTEQLPFHLSLSCIGEVNGNPLQCSCLVESKGNLIEQRDLTFSDFVANYFPYATFTNFVSAVTIEEPPEDTTLKITVDGGPLYGPIEVEKKIK